MAALEHYFMNQILLIVWAVALGLSIAAYAAITWLQWAVSRPSRKG